MSPAERYQKNKETILANAKKWREANLERAKATAKRSYLKNGTQAQSKWRKNNPERVKEFKNNYKQKNPLRNWICNKITSWRKKEGPVSNLTTNYLIELFESQQGRCYYTNEELEISGGKVRANTASLDRLDPDKGYVEGNVAWCSFFSNTMKGGLTEQEFYDFIRNILKNKDL